MSHICIKRNATQCNSMNSRVNVINVLMYQGVKREHVQLTWSTPWNVHDLFYVNGKFIYRTLLILFNPFVLHSQITPPLYYFMSDYNKSRLVLVLFWWIFGKFYYTMFYAVQVHNKCAGRNKSQSGSYLYIYILISIDK